tara:strand:- start:265 stop:1206 length:942 start_codon:yes stop_codon:yes gene_type:complete
MSDTTLAKAEIDYEATFNDYFGLLKPRVMVLVVFTALVGIISAPVEMHPFTIFVSIVFIALGGGAAGALNMWYEADIDILMRRTRDRPIPAGKITSDQAKAFGFALAGISVVMLGLAANWFSAVFLLFTIFFYVVIYTIWLKRWTPQNIVIGGAAGAFPPMIGWAVATSGISLESFLMFLLIFLWTPPHFWALALFMQGDYENARVPMLTVTHGKRSTRNHIFFYTVLLALFALFTSFTTLGGWVYLGTAIGLNSIFVGMAFNIWMRGDYEAEVDNFKVERRFFRYSLIYLFLQFGAILIDRGLGTNFSWGFL